jgi:ABC-type multidrug transport system fused ATPase/permease subunit
LEPLIWADEFHSNLSFTQAEQHSVTRGGFMTPKQTQIFFAVASILLLGAAIGAFFIALTYPATALGSAAVLSIAGATAVGIERIIEAFWTVIGLTKGTFWPVKQLNGLVGQLDASLDPFFTKARAEIETVATAAGKTADEIAKIKAEFDRVQQELNARITQLKTVAPDSQQVQLITTATTDAMNFLEAKYPEIAGVVALANSSVTGVKDFLATFKDNPGRRLISIYMGAFIGLIVATVLKLDLFHAAWGADPLKVSPTGVAFGVAFTGLMMGLGAGPTHEVIRSIQEFKKSFTAAPGQQSGTQ